MSEEQRPGSANVNVRQQRMELARQQYAERRRQSLQNLGMVMANENTTKTPETKSEESQETRPSSTSSQQSFQRMSSHESSAIESSKSKHDNLNTTGTYSVAEEDEEIESVPVVDSWRPPTSSSSRADSSVRIVGAGKPSDEDEDADAEHDAHRRTATQKKSEDEDDVFGVKSSKPRSDSSSDGRSSSASSAVNHEKDEAKRKAEIEKLMKEQGMDSAYVPKEVKPPPLVIDLSDIRTFLSKPAPKGGMIQCKVIRDKAGVEKLYPRYNFYLEKQDVFFMSARKRKKSKSSNYLLSLDAEDMGRDSGNYMGKVRSNFMGTEFVLFDKGENPKKSKETETPTIGPRQELGFMLYETNFLGMKGPRKMTIVIPAVREDGTRAIWKPSSSSDSMIDHYRRKDYRDMLILQNKAPTWHPESQSFVLNFRGRVTVASVKNFQLVAQGKVDDVLLQFGRVGEDQFTLDFQYPISPMQAFGIALSSFDGVSVSLPKKTLWMNSQSAENSRDLSGQVPKPLQDSIPFHEAGCTRGTCDTRFTYRNHKRILIDVVGEKWRRESMPKPEVKLPAGFQISLTIDDEAPTEPQEMSKKAKEASGAFDTVVGDYIQRCESLRIGPDAALLAYLEAFSHGAVSTKLLLTHRWSDADLTAAASALFTVGPHLLELHWPLYHASRRSPFSVQAAAPSARAHSLIHHGAKWSRQGWFLLAHVLAKMPNLSHLTIPHQALSDDDFVSVLLPALQKLPKLKELRLYGNHLTHKSATPLAESIRLWPSLTFLDMANNWLAYSGTTILKNALESCKKERGVIGLRYRGNHVYEEAFSVATHLAGFVASVYGVYYLMLKANANGSPSYMWSAYLFGSSLMMMFASSTLFHTFFRMSLLHDLFQKMDHASIYCLIAGSYTPYLLISLANSPSSFYMMCFQWSFCVFGVFLSLLGVSPQLRSFSCLMMGWSIMFTIQEVYQALTQDAFIWLVVGGLFYSFGVIFYLRKGAFSHGIWHLFVMGGAFSHYWSIYHYIM